MQASKDELARIMNTKNVARHEAVWGNVQVEYNIFKERFDVAPLLKGLPENRDPCPRWGIVVKGQMHAIYDGKEEVVNAGDAYYFPPGHTFVAEAGTEAWQFSPADKLKETLDVVKSNLEAIRKKNVEQNHVCSIFFPNVFP